MKFLQNFINFSSILIILSSAQSSHRRLEQIQYESVSQFIFHNSKLCGDPFSDAVWLPVLDLCTIECDITKEYCVENEELTQQCKPLPEDCQSLLRKSLKQIQRHIRSQRTIST